MLERKKYTTLPCRPKSLESGQSKTGVWIPRGALTSEPLSEEVQPEGWQGAVVSLDDLLHLVEGGVVLVQKLLVVSVVEIPLHHRTREEVVTKCMYIWPRRFILELNLNNMVKNVSIFQKDLHETDRLHCHIKTSRYYQH